MRCKNYPFFPLKLLEGTQRWNAEGGAVLFSFGCTAVTW